MVLERQLSEIESDNADMKFLTEFLLNWLDFACECDPTLSIYTDLKAKEINK